MLVSQLIYTGCGKNKTGAFEVWSKSADITKAEENEIRDKMIYKRPPELPSAPTQEELDTIFPKKSAYFFLSSGRACIAQSSYIGKVYSDLDMRTGNYIIHAFVFEKTDALSPMNYMYNPIFKQGLTYQEWHDDGAPAELPQIDFPENAAPITKQEIDEFFADNSINNFKLLLQAVINSMADGKKITFHDSFKKLQLWYKALSICLPKSKHKEMTYSTFFTPSVMLASQMQANAAAAQATEIKIRNIGPNVPANMFNYQQEARKGNYAFNFEAGLLPEGLVAGKYVDMLVDLLSTNLFKAIMLVDTISKIADTCGVDYDTALEIHYILTKQFTFINQVEKLESLVDFVVKYYSANVAEVADGLYDYGIAGGNWAMSSKYSRLFKFIFNNSKSVDKNQMIAKYINNQRAFGVDYNSACEEYARAFKQNAPFDWSYFLNYVFCDSAVKAHISEAGGKFSVKYLFFDAIVDALSSSQKNEEQKRYALQFFVNTAADSLRAESATEMNSLLKSIERGGAKNRSWLIKTTYASVKGARRLSDTCSISFTLDMIEACGDEAVGSALLGELMLENQSNMDFVKTYIERSERSTRVYSPIMDILGKDEKYKGFIDSVEMYKFSISSYASKAQMREYFDKFYSQGKDNGLFNKKLRQYMSGVRENELIDTGLDLYTLWFKNMDSLNSNDIECVVSICRAMFDVPLETLREYIFKKGPARLDDVLKKVEGRFAAPTQYGVVVFGENVKKMVKEICSEKNTKRIDEVRQILIDDKFYEGLENTEPAKKMFIDIYLKSVFDIYLATANEENFVNLYLGAFGRISGYSNLKDCFIRVMDSLRDNEFDLVLKATVICACHQDNKLGEFLNDLSVVIIEDMGRRRKKFFAYLLEKLPEKYQEKTKAYVDNYDKKPKPKNEPGGRPAQVVQNGRPGQEEPKEKKREGGFFQRLFGGIFGGKKDDENK